jgi:hypothetical protein
LGTTIVDKIARIPMTIINSSKENPLLFFMPYSPRHLMAILFKDYTNNVPG